MSDEPIRIGEVLQDVLADIRQRTEEVNRHRANVLRAVRGYQRDHRGRRRQRQKAHSQEMNDGQCEMAI